MILSNVATLHPILLPLRSRALLLPIRDVTAMLNAIPMRLQAFSVTKQTAYAKQAVTSTKTAVTLSTVTAMMELLALVAVSALATLGVGTRSRYLKSGHILPSLSCFKVVSKSQSYVMLELVKRCCTGWFF